MLSYQHSYHAGNLADLHKHGLLAKALEYMTRKDKPVSYIETHAGRGIYDLRSHEAVKTGEAAQGIGAHSAWFGSDHPLTRVRSDLSKTRGRSCYPGSPAIAAGILRETDNLHLAELHPQENAALSSYFGRRANIHKQDGFDLAHALTPPNPRRGLMLIDPSYEVKSDYAAIPTHVRKLHKAWNVGVIMLWYPILTNGAHIPMVTALTSGFPDAWIHEVAFPPARPGHGMVGSGMFILNAPYGLDEEMRRLDRCFDRLTKR